MRLRTEIAVTLGALLALQVVTVLASVSLMTRVGPTISIIVTENVVSEAAVEEMLAALADPQPDSAARFAKALAAAQANVTETGEAELLGRIASNTEAALSGESGARAVIVKDLQAIGDLNRDSIYASEAEARRLSMVGAWSIVVLGAVAFAGSQWSLRRLSRRIATPLREVEEAVVAYRRGDTHRRGGIGDAPVELRTLVAEINGLFDGLALLATEDAHGPALDRAALLALLDETEDPILLFGGDGRVRACNKAALRMTPQEQAEARLDPDRWARVELPNGSGALLRRLDAL